MFSPGLHGFPPGSPVLPHHQNMDNSLLALLSRNGQNAEYQFHYVAHCMIHDLNKDSSSILRQTRFPCTSLLCSPVQH